MTRKKKTRKIFEIEMPLITIVGKKFFDVNSSDICLDVRVVVNDTKVISITRKCRFYTEWIFSQVIKLSHFVHFSLSYSVTFELFQRLVILSRAALWRIVKIIFLARPELGPILILSQEKCVVYAIWNLLSGLSGSGLPGLTSSRQRGGIGFLRLLVTLAT